MYKKFRAYYKLDSDTPDGALKFIQTEINHILYFVYDGDIKYPFYIPFMDDDWLVQQYLGFQDDNGSDVYEGDIVEYRSWDNEWERIGPINKDVVQFNNGNVYPKPYHNDCEDGFYSHGIDQYKIIGNIMENPELLDKK